VLGLLLAEERPPTPASPEQEQRPLSPAEQLAVLQQCAALIGLGRIVALY
jgi:hypothetical protein